ncbi:VOC family protein [Burkholderia cepacia]|uniref:Glyoxalase-like domain protein n=1 Tax=Burkholderia cepacia TaxID=292 RepID=A0AA88Z5U2_BURCE|nr:glyoxalase [Burkholderia cepacia]KGB99195.1 glyoxalase-like domain protein [Burkholderia cepacia]
MKSLRSVLLAAMLAGGLAIAPATFAKPPTPPAAVPAVAVGPQYDTTHVCVAPEDFDRFTDSFVATFGGKKSKQGVFQVTPTPSQTMSQLVLTPVGTISVFGFKTPIPYPFCAERTGYLVTDMDVAVKSAREHGADVIVDTFADPIGRDAIVTWAGGVNMQLYWHTQAPHYDALQTIPENRVYVSPQSVRKFVHDFVKFSKGKVVSDDPKAPGIEIGRPDDTYRRIRVESGFGKMTVLVTDGHLPYPFGREMTGYEVSDLAATLKQAQAAGVTVLVPPFESGGRDAALVQFPGGYVAEIHASAAR